MIPYPGRSAATVQRERDGRWSREPLAVLLLEQDTLLAPQTLSFLRPPGEETLQMSGVLVGPQPPQSKPLQTGVGGLQSPLHCHGTQARTTRSLAAPQSCGDSEGPPAGQTFPFANTQRERLATPAPWRGSKSPFLPPNNENIISISWNRLT